MWAVTGRDCPLSPESRYSIRMSTPRSRHRSSPSTAFPTPARRTSRVNHTFDPKYVEGWGLATAQAIKWLHKDANAELAVEERNSLPEAF